MSKILLIPGFQSEASLAILPDHSKDPTAGFGVFSNYIKNGQAIPYRWGIQRRFTALDCLNPVAHMKLYWDEKKLSISDQTLTNLRGLIKLNNFETIVCHSMGCQVLLSYMIKFGLPEGVHKIIFVQGDITNQSLNINTDSLTSIINKRVEWLNLHCFWDQALVSSAIAGLQLPIGLFGAESSIVKNRSWPLWRRINLHTSSINDPGILKLI